MNVSEYVEGRVQSADNRYFGGMVDMDYGTLEGRAQTGTIPSIANRFRPDLRI